MPLTEVQNLVNTRLAQKISQVGGVGLVSHSGGQRPAVRIQADTKALASANGIGLDTLRTAITAANANSAKGSFDGPQARLHHQRQRPARHGGRLQEPHRRWKNGAPVRMTDVARVVDGAENTQLGAWAANLRRGR
jgi:multidrug efflux pump